MVLKLEQSVKSESHLIINELKLILDISGRLKKTKEEVNYSREKIAEINGNLLMNKE